MIKTVSVHKMLLFILGFISNKKSLKTVSVHKMLLFIFNIRLQSRQGNMFPYIKCCCLS